MSQDSRTQHPSPQCVVELRVERPAASSEIGSGYLVAPGWVLTARHVVEGASSVRAWIDPPPNLTVEAESRVDEGGKVILEQSDWALIPVESSYPKGLPSVSFGLLDRESGIGVPVKCFGLPWFRIRDREAPRDNNSPLVRETGVFDGHIIPANGRKTGRFTMSLRETPHRWLQLSPEHSRPEAYAEVAAATTSESHRNKTIWDGMSGAAVWAGSRLIGVVASFELRDAANNLTVHGCPDIAALPPEWTDRLPRLLDSTEIHKVGIEINEATISQFSYLAAKAACGRLGSDDSQLSFRTPLSDRLDQVSRMDALLDHEAAVTWVSRASFHVRQVCRQMGQGLEGTQIGQLFDQISVMIDLARTDCAIESGRTRAIEHAESARVQLDAVTNALTDLRQRLDRVADGAGNDHLAREALICDIYLERAENAVANIDSQLSAELSGVTVIEGEWGTGKTFGLATFALQELAAGGCVVFLEGKDISAAQNDWLRQIVDQVAFGATTDDLLDALELITEDRGRRAFIIIDAVNEIERARSSIALEKLIADIRTHRAISVILSQRTGLRDNLTANARIGRYQNVGMDPAEAWEILRRYGNRLPEISTPWLVPDYSKPLVVRLLARVISTMSEPVNRPMAVVDLLQKWVAIVESEWAEEEPSPGTNKSRKSRVALGDILEYVSSTENATVAEFLSRRPHDTDSIRSGLVRLVDEGILVVQGDAIRYRLQRISEIQRAQYLLKHGGARKHFESIPRDRDDSAVIEPLTSALVEACPYHDQEQLAIRYQDRRGVRFAHLRSFANRPSSAISDATLKAAKRAASSGYAMDVIYAALANSLTPSHPLGASFLVDTWLALSPRQRRREWVEPLESLLTDVRLPGFHHQLGEVLAWIYRTAAANGFRDSHAAELAPMLVCLLVLPPSNLASSAVRVLATVLCNYPDTLPTVMKVARDCGDSTVLSAVWAATLGAIERSRDKDENLRRLVKSQLEIIAGPSGRLPWHRDLAISTFRCAKRLGLIEAGVTEWVEFRQHLLGTSEPWSSQPPGLPLLVSNKSSCARSIRDVGDKYWSTEEDFYTVVSASLSAAFRRAGVVGSWAFARGARRDRFLDPPSAAEYAFEQDLHARFSIKSWNVATGWGYDANRQPANWRNRVPITLARAVDRPPIDGSAPLLDDVHAFWRSIRGEDWGVPPAVWAMATSNVFPMEERQIRVTDLNGESWYLFHGRFSGHGYGGNHRVDFGHLVKHTKDNLLDTGPDLDLELRPFTVIVESMAVAGEVSDPAKLPFDEFHRSSRSPSSYSSFVTQRRPLPASRPPFPTTEIYDSQTMHDALGQIAVPSRYLTTLLGLQWSGEGSEFLRGGQKHILDGRRLQPPLDALFLRGVAREELRLHGLTLVWRLEVHHGFGEDMEVGWLIAP